MNTSNANRAQYFVKVFGVGLFRKKLVFNTRQCKNEVKVHPPEAKDDDGFLNQ